MKVRRASDDGMLWIMPIFMMAMVVFFVINNNDIKTPPTTYSGTLIGKYLDADLGYQNWNLLILTSGTYQTIPCHYGGNQGLILTQLANYPLNTTITLTHSNDGANTCVIIQ